LSKEDIGGGAELVDVELCLEDLLLALTAEEDFPRQGRLFGHARFALYSERIGSKEDALEVDQPISQYSTPTS
jgi:hypothetical protein